MTKKILCATDGTAHSERAVELAADMAKRYGAELVICTVNLVRGGGRAPLIPVMDDADAERILDGAASMAAKAGVSASTQAVLKSREVATAVVQYCEEQGCDHVVTGTGDKHGVTRLVLGSVAADIVSRAHCPVTVAR